MRLPAAGGTGDGGHCCRCAVPGALFLHSVMIFPTSAYNCDIWTGQRKTARTRHATHPPAVPMVEGDAEGGSGGDLANGPLDRRTNRGSNPRRRQAPPMAHTTRPSMPLTLLGVNLVRTLTRHYPKGEVPHSLVRICHRCVAARGIRDPWAVQVGSGAHVHAGCVQPTTLSRRAGVSNSTSPRLSQVFCGSSIMSESCKLAVDAMSEEFVLRVLTNHCD